jgi:hypothetical protein
MPLNTWSAGTFARIKSFEGSQGGQEIGEDTKKIPELPVSLFHFVRVGASLEAESVCRTWSARC